MHPHLAPTLAAEADPTVLATICGLLARDVRDARNADDLLRRLARKGYGIEDGYLVTAPHGKRVCPIAYISG